MKRLGVVMLDEMVSQGRPAATIIRGSDLRIWRDAGAMLEDAQRQAASIREAATAAFEAEARRGYQEGRERAAEEMAQPLLAASQAAEAALREIEAAMPALVCDIIEGMLGDCDLRELLRPAVRHAIGRLRRGTAAVLRAAPDCLQALRVALEEAPDAALGVRIEVDPALAAGRCLFESELGTVELGIEAQLRVLRDMMHSRWEKAA